MTGDVRARIPGWSEWRTIRTDRADGTRDATAKEQFDSYLLNSLQMQNLSVMAGSGTSYGAGGPSMSDLWTACVVEAPDGLGAKARKVVDRQELPVGEDIEELLSRCDAFLQFDRDEHVARFRTYAVTRILELCRLPGLGASDRLGTHRSFLRRLARRRARDARLQVFTTNYDRCFELAAGQLGMICIDGFSFTEPRRFDPTFFEYDIVQRTGGQDEHVGFVPGVIRYYKLHGSVDWKSVDRNVVVDSNAVAQNVALIYPASTKFRYSYQQPHLELMAHYLSCLRATNTCLVSVGFGFEDHHLAEPILAALETNPHFRLIVVSPRGEAKLAGGNCNPAWVRLRELANRTDVGFVGADFDAFASMIPDLRALSPAERLLKAVNEATRT